MPRIPGTTFHDEDPPKPTLEVLSLRLKFYESVMQHMGPHQRGDKRCELAVASGLVCCNPKCNGQWGTGCWCCHSLGFADEATPDIMRGHLELRAEADRKNKPSRDEYPERAAPIIKALEEYLATGNHERAPHVKLHGRQWTIPEILTEIRNKTEEGQTWVAVGGFVRAALSAGR
jgi:hypothetical protein